MPTKKRGCRGRGSEQRRAEALRQRALQAAAAAGHGIPADLYAPRPSDMTGSRAPAAATQPTASRTAAAGGVTITALHATRTRRAVASPEEGLGAAGVNTLPAIDLDVPPLASASTVAFSSGPTLAVPAAAPAVKQPPRAPDRPAGSNGKPTLHYNPLDTRDWQMEAVNRNSAEYQEALRRLHPQFPKWLRFVALRGERYIRDVRTPLERRALIDVARQFGYEPTNARSTTCRLVFVEASQRVYLRCGQRNPHLMGELAKELSRMEVETRRLNARRQGKPEPLLPIPGENREGPGGSGATGRSRPLGNETPTVHCGFTDLFVHRDVIEVLRHMAYDIGVFRGRPSVAGDDLAAHYNSPRTVLDGLYIYDVDVALSYSPRWEAELNYICSMPGKDGGKGVVPFSAEDPYPASDSIRSSPAGLHHYREYVRPFLFDWKADNTRCPTELRMDSDWKPPSLAVQMGNAFSLRWDKDEAGNVFMRRWMRHTLHTFGEFLPAFKEQDELNISLMMREIQKRQPELDPVDLLAVAKDKQPHFATLSLSLDIVHFRRELGELQAYAAKAESTVYMMEQAPLVFIAATSRDLPMLNTNQFTMLFTRTGAYVGPSFLGLQDINTKMGEGKVLPPSMIHLVNRFATSAADAVELPRLREADDRSEDGHRPRHGDRDRRRRRSNSSSRASSNAESDSGRGNRHHHHHHRRGEEHATVPEQQQQFQSILDPAGRYSPFPPLTTSAVAGGAMALPYSYGQLEQQQQQQQPQQQQQQQQQPYRSRHIYPPALPASSLYDVIMGSWQRQQQPGVTAELHTVEWYGHGMAPTAPTAVGFLLDHIKREATVGSGTS